MKQRVLVVEDGPIDRLIIQRQLNEVETEWQSVETAEEALKLLSNDHEFSVLLVDWNLPGMGGIEFVRTVRASELLRRLKIVMVTGENDMQHVHDAILAGVDEYLMKPVTRATFLEKLKLVGIELTAKEVD